MPNVVVWTGASITTAQVTIQPVSSCTASTTLTATINDKPVTYACTGTDTTAAAAGWAAACAASTAPEFQEVAFTSSGSNLVATGPADGTPFTVAFSAGGSGGSLGAAVTTAPASPNDMSLGANYSTGSLPGNGDTLVFQNGDVSAKWNLSALASVGLAKVIRRATYTGTIGLPDTNTNGYQEYRVKELSTDAPSIQWEPSSQDAAGQFRLLSTAASAVSLIVSGDASGVQPGAEPLEIRGLPASSVVDVSGGSVAVAKYAGQSATVAVLLATGGTVSLGDGVTLGTASYTDGRGEIRCGYTTFTLDGNSSVVVTSAASGTTTTIDGGTLTWRSTGSPGAVTVGSGGEMTFNSAPGSVTVGTITLQSGSTFRDRANRLARPYTLVYQGCTPSEVTVEIGSGLTWQAQA